jgi:predicted PurR-regulated permease PerM
LQDKINAGIIEDINSSEKFNNILTLFKIEKSQLMEKAVDTAKQYTFAFFSNITSIISLQLGLILKFFCMVLMLFFLLKDGASLGPMVYRALPFPDDIEHDIAERLRRVINVLITGNLFIMALQGSMLGLGLHIAGFPAVLLWGALGSILSLIPVIGTSIIWIPAALYLLFTGSYLMALFVGIWSIAWYFLLENLLKPLIFGGTLSFHPVLLFFLLLGSIQTFGIAGVLIGPIILTLFISMWEIYKMLDLYAPKKNPKPTD